MHPAHLPPAGKTKEGVKMKSIVCGILAGLLIAGLLMSTYYIAGNEFVRSGKLAEAWIMSWIMGAIVGVGVFSLMEIT